MSLRPWCRPWMSWQQPMRRQRQIGDQIVYIPNHAEDMFHPDVEFGFITGFSPSGSVFCRYWLNPKREVLRTKANSESTPINMIKRCDIKSQEEITKLLVYFSYSVEEENAT